MTERQKKNDEVELTQYLRPDGRKRKVFASVGEDIVNMSKGLILSCEELTTGQVAIYCRREGESEESERTYLAINGPGPSSPTEVLIKAIKEANSETIS